MLLMLRCRDADAAFATRFAAADALSLFAASCRAAAILFLSFAYFRCFDAVTAAADFLSLLMPSSLFILLIF